MGHCSHWEEQMVTLGSLMATAVSAESAGDINDTGNVFYTKGEERPPVGLPSVLLPLANVQNTNSFLILLFLALDCLGQSLVGPPGTQSLRK